MTVDWTALWEVNTPVLELVVRGTAMYLILFAALRILVRRHIGSLSLMDLLLMVLIADAAQNAMSADYKSISEGMVLCGTLIGWNYLFDWLAYRFPAFQRVLEPPPLPVIRNGKFLLRNMRQEFVTKDELLGQLRQQGVTDVQAVKVAYIESDGGVSVIGRGGKSAESPRKDKSAAVG
jgi:uncharacterized membrane protein YcaP (DUF421 family)